jgi:GMP synthase-like glutamine amidotransferase
VTLTGEARTDPVFSALPRELVTLQWHGDTFDLPKGGVRLASSPAYANQAFRFGRAYGVQFHLEVSGDMAREWAEVPAYVDSLDRTLRRDGAQAFLEAIAERADEMRSVGRALFERWLDHVVARSGRTAAAS